MATDYAIEYSSDTMIHSSKSLYASSDDAHEFKGAPNLSASSGTGFTSEELSHVGPGLLKF